MNFSQSDFCDYKMSVCDFDFLFAFVPFWNKLWDSNKSSDFKLRLALQITHSNTHLFTVSHSKCCVLHGVKKSTHTKLKVTVYTTDIFFRKLRSFPNTGLGIFWTFRTFSEEAQQKNCTAVSHLIEPNSYVITTDYGGLYKLKL